MKELQIILNNILTDKNTNLKPENLKKDVTCLGVTGTLETSTTSGGVKQFSTVEEMNSSTGNTEGDLAIVYSLNIRNIQQGETITNTLLFPDTVTFDTTVDAEFGIYGDLTIDNDALEFTLTSDKCYISSVGSEFCRIIYDSTNGKIYTKTSSTVSGISVTNLTVPELDEHLYSFVQIAIASFNGIYKYNGTSWELAPTDLTTVADEVCLTKFYGKNGIETGTLTANISNSFADANAKIYDKIQKAYDDMTPRVLTDTDKTIDTNIYFIPTKSDSTVLLDTSAVTDMKQMFYQCSNLITIPLLDTNKVTTMQETFYGCTSLTTIPLLNTNKVTTMENIVYNCTSLSDNSLNNILAMCANASAYTSIKSLKQIGLTSAQATKCKTLSNYSAFTAAGWTTGY